MPHTRLTVTATSVVEVDEPAHEGSLFDQRPWERSRDALAARRIDADLTQYLLESPRIALSEAYREYARGVVCAGRGSARRARVAVLADSRGLRLRPGSTSVTTPLAEVFAKRRGVCQDFAHLAIACLRAIGLPARYVSGYLETDPPPGRPKLTGVDGSHAWLSVFLPDAAG